MLNIFILSDFFMIKIVNIDTFKYLYSLLGSNGLPVAPKK